jgi:hypothetical protein
MENLVLLLWLCADPVAPTPDANATPDANTPSVIAPTRKAVLPQDMTVPLEWPKYRFDNKSDICLVCTRSEWFRNSGRRDD